MRKKHACTRQSAALDFVSGIEESHIGVMQNYAHNNHI